MSLILRDGTLAIFQTFRRPLDAILRLAEAVESLAKAQTSATPSMDRLDALELSRFQFEAEVAGILLEAKGKLKAANNSEARERQLKKSYEKGSDPFDEGGDAGSGESPILPDDVGTGEEERVQALHLAVAPSPKAAALNHKWSRY